MRIPPSLVSMSLLPKVVKRILLFVFIRVYYSPTICRNGYSAVRTDHSCLAFHIWLYAFVSLVVEEDRPSHLWINTHTVYLHLCYLYRHALSLFILGSFRVFYIIQLVHH